MIGYPYRDMRPKYPWVSVTNRSWGKEGLKIRVLWIPPVNPFRESDFEYYMESK